MNSLTVAGIIFTCAFGGALAGLLLQKLVPADHLRAESRDVIRLGTGLIATMAALVVGLLVGSAKSSFDSQQNGFQQLSTNIIMLDRALAHYGPEAQQSRELLRTLVATTTDSLWPDEPSQRTTLSNAQITSDGAAFYDAIRALKPATDEQRAAQSQALQTASEIARIRWLLSEQNEESLPLAFLVVLAFWLFVLFTSFGLFAPRNATVTIVLMVCALSVSGAVLLIVDLDQPFEGLIQVSSYPLRHALDQLVH